MFNIFIRPINQLIQNSNKIDSKLLIILDNDNNNK